MHLTDPADPAVDGRLIDELVRLLAQRGPLTVAEISEALGEDSDDVEWDDRLFEAVDDSPRIVELRGDRLADVVTLIADCTFTRRLTEAEAAVGYVELGGDLQPLVDVIVDSVPLARHGRARVTLGTRPGYATTDRLTGPDGWLDDASAGDLVGLQLVDGLLAVTVRPEPRSPDDAARAFAVAARPFLDDADHDPPRAPLNDTCWEALAAAPAAFSGVLPPLSTVAEAAGLQITESVVLPGDVDVTGLPATTDVIRDAIARIHLDLDALALTQLAMLRNTTRRLELGARVGDDDLDRAAAALADPDVHDAYTRETSRPTGALLGDAVASAGRRAGRAAAHHLLARDAIERNDPMAADTHLRDALEVDPAFVPALIDAAVAAEMRGDASRALQLRGRAGHTDGADVQRLRRYAAGVTTGRNEPCECGSGRKTKRCCAGRSGGSLPRRAPWLLEKLYLFTDDCPIEERLRERLAVAGHLTNWAEHAGTHPIVEDVVLFDLGLLDDFLECWGAVLPADERALARRWWATHRGLYDVRRTQGSTTTLVDRSDGSERVAVHGGQPPPRGAMILARLLPDGVDGWVLTAGVLIEAEHHPAVARSVDPTADPLEIAAAWGSPRPVLSTTEGEPSVHCVWQAPVTADQRHAVETALRARGLREDPPGAFTELVEVDGDMRIRGTVEVGDDAVRIETTSVPRVERLIDDVRSAVGDVVRTIDRRTPVWRAMEDHQLYGLPAAPQEPSAEVRAVVQEAIREQERRWLDERVPALDGLTPREARDHPSGRAALLALLDSFGDAWDGGFNASRLRTLLDLPPSGS